MKKIITLTTLFLFLLAAGISNIAFADTSGVVELTLNEAIERAIKHSEAVKKAELEIERMEALKDEAADKLDFIPTGGIGYNPQLEATWASVLQADLTWMMSKKQRSAIIDGLALDVCNAYWNILSAMKKVDAMKVALEQAQEEFRHARAKYNLGMLTEVAIDGSSGLKQAEAKLEQAESDLETAKNDLDNAYVKFNNLVGLQPDDRPVLIEQLKFHKLKIENLTTEVNRALERSPSVWLAEQNVDLQKFYQNLLRATGEYRPYEARQAEQKQAEVDAISAKEATRLIVRDLYYQIRNLEEQYKSLEASKQVAVESLNVVKAMYEVGMATKADVTRAMAALENINHGLKQIIASHAYMKLVFQKPWALQYSTAN